MRTFLRTAILYTWFAMLCMYFVNTYYSEYSTLTYIMLMGVLLTGGLYLAEKDFKKK